MNEKSPRRSTHLLPLWSRYFSTVFLMASKNTAFRLVNAMISSIRSCSTNLLPSQERTWTTHQIWLSLLSPWSLFQHQRGTSRTWAGCRAVHRSTVELLSHLRQCLEGIKYEPRMWRFHGSLSANISGHTHSSSGCDCRKSRRRRRSNIHNISRCAP
jgi:hypothetical protein